MSDLAEKPIDSVPGERSICPNPGPQEDFLSNPADICIGGGQAGGGKTFALVAEPLRHCNVPGFTAALFRRIGPELYAEGGPVNESAKLYPHTGARWTRNRWRWPSGASLSFSHLQYEKTKYSWKGAQLALLLFDQLEDFTEGQFWYLVSRMRSTCGVRPYLRATCNPIPDDDPVGGWLARLLAWWIDQDTGFPIPERAGKLRYMLRVNEEIEWADTREELAARFPRLAKHILSLSFVPMRLEDNPVLRDADPEYEARLEMLPYVDRMRLRHGNWKARARRGTMFRREWFAIAGAVPADAQIIRRVRYWDVAATEDDGDWTCGARLALARDGRVFVEHVARAQLSPGGVDKLMLQIATLDGPTVAQREEREPGASGKSQIVARAKLLRGFDYRGITSSENKRVRWAPFASQAEVGNVFLVAGRWNHAFLNEAEDAPDGPNDDQLDAVSGAYAELVGASGSKKIPVGQRRRRHNTDQCPGCGTVFLYENGARLPDGRVYCMSCADRAAK